MKLLVIGGGGREMAIVTHLAQQGHDVYTAGASDAIAEIAASVPMPSTQPPGCWHELAQTARDLEVALTIVGSEAPLSTGIADVFHEYGLPIFAPTLAAARIETSKAFAKEVMTRAGVPTANYQAFTSNASAMAYLHADNTLYPTVLKENGLRAGKGVTIAAHREEAEHTLAELELSEDNPLIIEEFLEGFEFSLIVIAHGTRFVALPVAQDHKPIGEGNTGANTGGMGAVSPVPRVSDAIYFEAVERVIKPTLAQMAADGTPFTGFLYAGLIATPTGVKVIEFNARLGDPEAEVILPRLEADLAEVALSLLSDGEIPHSFPVTPHTCLGIVLSAPGYPGKVTAYPEIPKALLSAVDAHPDAGITHMGTKLREDGAWTAAGGRVAIVTMVGTDIAQCRSQLLALLEEGLSDSELYYRRDIGTFAY